MRLLVLLLSLGTVAAPAGAAGGPCSVDALAWMAGSWSTTRDSVREEEHWMAPRGNFMLGMNRIASASRVSFEYFRIAQRSDGVDYISSPGGASPTSFALKDCVPGRVVFENLEHDFPQRILYWRDHPDTLHARIEGMVKGRLRSAEWTWTRGTLTP